MIRTTVFLMINHGKHRDNPNKTQVAFPKKTIHGEVIRITVWVNYNNLITTSPLMMASKVNYSPLMALHISGW